MSGGGEENQRDKGERRSESRGENADLGQRASRQTSGGRDERA